VVEEVKEEPTTTMIIVELLVNIEPESKVEVTPETIIEPEENIDEVTPVAIEKTKEDIREKIVEEEKTTTTTTIEFKDTDDKAAQS
jgi:hypothetical protein